MALHIVPVIKFVLVQVLVPIAIEKAPGFIDKIGKKIKEKKASQNSMPPSSQNAPHFPTNTHN